MRSHRSAAPVLPLRALAVAICALFGIAAIASCVRTPTRSTDTKDATAWGAIAVGPGRAMPGTDRDKDGVPDDRERDLGSNPERADSDDDGYADGIEDRLADFGFDPARADTDGDHDGLTDAREAELGTNAASPDTDGDGWSDLDETLNAYFGFDARTKTADADFDGLGDALEKRLGSSPRKVDSNGDGISDFQAYSADESPVGPALKGPLADLMGTTYSPAMREALTRMRKGAAFPAELARQLPYADVTAPLLTANARLRPSAALMQRAVYNPHNSPGIYKSYTEIEQELSKLATDFPSLVRLFYWTGQTIESCDGKRRPGRKIYAVKVSANPQNNEAEPEVAFLGTHHARELITAYQTMRLLHALTDGYASNSTIKKLVDKREVWVIPVVNPNGYERAVSGQVDWRKNTRLVDGQKRCGIDLNRNYAFGHPSMFTPAQRMSLPDIGRSGVDPGTGNLLPDDETYPGPSAFSEVETQAVRGLAHSQFATRNKREVDGLVCMLSWHSYGGVVGHPMGHVAVPPATNLNAADVAPFDALTKAMATAANYTDVQDDYATVGVVDGCSTPHYMVYGDSNDWFYKDGHTFSALIEEFSSPERGSCPTGSISNDFNPQTAPLRDTVADTNVKAAVAMLKMCPP